MQVKSIFVQASEFTKSGFCKRPKAFYTVDVRFSIYKFVDSMFDAIMFLVTNIYQPGISAPSIRMNDAFHTNFPSNNCSKCFAFAVWNDLSVDLSVTLKNTKHNGFSSSSTTSDTFNSPGTEIAFINFDFSSKW